MNEESYLALGVIIFLAILFPIVFNLTKKIGPKRQTKLKNIAYESGITKPFGATGGKYSVKFYLVAIFFVLFDVEILFMFPWALNVRELGMLGIVEMFSFIGLLFSGLIYIYYKKALSWN